MLNSNVKKPVRSQRSSSSTDALFLFALNSREIDILKAHLNRESDPQRLQNMLSAKHYSIVDIAMNNYSHSLLDLIFKQANYLHDRVINKALYNRALNLITREQYSEVILNIIFENLSDLDCDLQRIVLSMQRYGSFIRAAENNNLKEMELLLKQAHILGIQQNMIKEQNYQAFRVAADRGNLQVVELLLDKAHDLNIQQKMMKARSYYAFKAAVANNRLEVVKLLLSKTNNLIIMQEMLSTTDHYPFWSSAEEGNLDILEVLWKNSGKVGGEFQKSMLNHKDYSVFQYAMEVANKDVLQWLWRKAGDLGLQKDMLEANHFVLNITFKKEQEQYKEIFKWLKTEVEKVDSSLWNDILACPTMRNRIKRSYSCSSHVNQKDHSKQKIHNLKLQQKALLSFSRFLPHLPNARIKVIIQDPYAKTFESNAVITRIFSQSLLLDSNLAEQFLNNLQISAEFYERLAQGKQISKKEEKEVVSLNNLLDAFKTQLASSTSSLPSSLSHVKSYKTLEDLSIYVTELRNDFAIHLVTSNHIVAIYRIGNDYTYFDSNFAFVQGIETADQLIKVIKKGASTYEIEQEGFLVEHFDVTRANNELTAKQKETLTESIQTERHLLSLQDQKFGPININGQQIHRVTLYDIGARLHSEGSVPVLINSDMTLNKKKLMSYLKKGKIRITAREYLDQLRGNSAKEIAQATKIFPFEGSRFEVEYAEQARKLVLSDSGNKLKSYELNKLLKSPVEQSIKALPYYLEAKHWSNGLTNAAGRISLLHGGYSIIHSLRHGDYESFALGTGEMGFSLFSQLIEDRMVKATPQMIKQMKHSIYLSRGFAGVVASPFDIYDLIRSSIDTSNAVKGSKEWRDNIASATFAASSLVSSVAFTAMSKPGIGTIIGLVIIAGQGIYSGISMIAEYDENYQLTMSQKSRIFLHTLTLQEIPQNVQDDLIKQDIMNDYAKKAWQYLQNNTQAVAYVMGLGNVIFQDTIYHEAVKPYWEFLSTGMESHIYREGGIKITKSYRKHALLPSEYSYINVSTIDQYDFSSPNFEVYHKKQTRKILPPIIIKQSFSPIISHIAHHVMHRQLFHPKPPSTIEAKIFCFAASPEGYCTSTAILDYQRINKSGKIVVNLSLVNQGTIIGSNKWQNYFNIYAGRSYIFGGYGTTNVFTVNNVTFSGGIVGGNNSLNILVSNSDAKYLAYNNNYATVLSCNKKHCSAFNIAKISHFIGRKALPDSVNCAGDNKIYIDSQGGNKNDYDIIQNCREVVVSPYTEITSENSDGGDTLYYIKPDSGHVRINALPSKKQRFLVFPTTDLLNESNMNYSPQTNTFSIHIPTHNFTAEVEYYLRRQGDSYTYNFILIDKYGSVIEPLIEQQNGKIDLYYLRAETKLTDIDEIVKWYRSIIKLKQVYGTIRAGSTSIIIGSDKPNIIPMVEGTVYAEGGGGSDLYNVLPGTAISVKINNYSDDQAYDVIYIPTIHSMIKIYAGLYDLYLHAEGVVDLIRIENYLFDKHYRHLMIIDKNKDTFIPLELGSEIRLVPFYHATENQHIFALSANKMNSEVMIDAMLEEITVYRDGNDLLLTSSKSLVIKLEEFYNKYWNNLTIHFIHGDKLNLEQLSELAKLAIDYQDEVKSIYFDNVREYQASSSSILHDSTEQIGVIVFEHSSDVKVFVDNNDLVFTDGSNTINVKNWSDTEHRISVLRIYKKPKTIEVGGLDKFDLSQVSEIQSLINKAILGNVIDKQIDKLDTEVVNGIKYVLSVHGIESGINTDKILGFDSVRDQEQFIVAHSSLYTKDTLDTVLKNQQAAEVLVWLVAKGYTNLILEDSSFTRELLLNNLNQCFGGLASKRVINRIIRKLETEAIDVIVYKIKSLIRHHKEALVEKIASGLENSTIIDIKEENHQRKRREVKNYEDQELFYAKNNANTGLKNNRLLSKLASGGQMLEAHGAENRSVLDIHEDLSTGVTTQLPVEVEFRKKSNQVINSGSRPSSWITDLFGRVKNSIGGSIAPSKEQVNTNIVQPEISSAFVDGFLILSDVGVRKFTGNKYKQPKHDSLLSPKELIERRMEHAAINAINNFEKICDDNDFYSTSIKPLTCLSDISVKRSDIKSYGVNASVKGML